jgi:hypothetical protein
VRKCLYTDAERALVRELYADTPTAEIAKRLGRETCSVYRIASSMGLRKSPEYLAGPNACRLRRGDGVGSGTRFKPGQVPANKGTRRPGWAPGRMAETQFKKGVRTGIAAKNWRPVGTILTDADGYLRIKIREGIKGEAYGFGNVRIWPLMQRHVWEQHKGPIPAGHAIVFKDGDRSNVVIDNLDCISRRYLMLRNTVHNYPKELAEIIQLSGALKRQVRKHEKQNDGSAQPPVRNTGSAERQGSADGH